MLFSQAAKHAALTMSAVDLQVSSPHKTMPEQTIEEI